MESPLRLQHLAVRVREDPSTLQHLNHTKFTGVDTNDLFVEVVREPSVLVIVPHRTSWCRRETEHPPARRLRPVDDRLIRGSQRAVSLVNHDEICLRRGLRFANE